MKPIRLVPVKEWQPRQPAAIEAFGVCRSQCPGGNRCECIGVHELHICSNPACYCHTRERYQGKRGK